MLYPEMKALIYGRNLREELTDFSPKGQGPGPFSAKKAVRADGRAEKSSVLVESERFERTATSRRFNG
ncbi:MULTISPECIES: hypothetical protein [unclassified Ruegeria]|uniref:hypothetical protein n=1 Tax=unclassified Ruegeria TaxID=2625375 RepID=UPI001489D7DF|nr:MULTISPECIES: hypothetical protein [unclassified Ruegeria]